MEFLQADFVLVSPLHDPEARLTGQIKEVGTTLRALCQDNVHVSATEATSPQTISALEDTGFPFLLQKGNLSEGIGANYRSAINIGVTDQAKHIFLVDFDRALHWANRYPQEMVDVMSSLNGRDGLVSCIRSIRAFETHPFEQRSTEAVINAIATRVAGLRVDIMSGAFGMSLPLATIITSESKRDDFGFCAEYLELALKHKLPINTVEVEGLEWETPDQFQDKITQEGYTAWLNEFETLDEWKKRIELIKDSTEELIPN